MANKPIDKEYLVASLKSFDEEVLSKKYNNSTGGSENTIESISVNGNNLTPDKNKNIDIIIPDISELEDNSHSHLNKETLDKFSESDEGKLLFDGSEIEGGAGTQGENGITPHIGDNGNWYIGEEDTGVTATGKDGQDGRSITSITTDKNNNVLVTFSDGITENIGELSVDSGVAIYSDYSTLPATISENAIVYCKNDYSDGSTIYSKGFYFADLDTSTYALISNGSGSVSSDWIDIVGKPFEDISPDDFELDSNGVLCLSSTTFDTVNAQLAAITNELSRKATIDDTDNSSTTTTWSASQIQAELDKKAESGSNHNHSNLTNVLDKLSADSNNNLVFDTKIIMSTNVYDINADGKVDSAEKADTIDGLLATIDELNHLQGATSNIQSQIDAISSGVNFKGEFADYATMTATITTPTKGDWVYVLADETQGAMNTQYVYDGTSWIYGGGKTTVNDATDTVKGVIQLAGDLTGVASSPQLATVTTAQTIGYVQSVTIDEKGRVTDITEDTTLAQRIADLEARPQIYVSSTQPTALKDGDIWIEG